LTHPQNGKTEEFDTRKVEWRTAAQSADLTGGLDVRGLHSDLKESDTIWIGRAVMFGPS
jgi:hypothetical protein